MDIATANTTVDRLFGARWVTRELPKIDRMSSPCLVVRFINSDDEFPYVPASVFASAERERAVANDISGTGLVAWTLYA